MKKFSIVFFIFGLFLTGNLFAQLKIGYVDSNTIMKQIPDAQDAQKVLDATIQEWKTELAKKQSALKSKKKDFEDKKLILSSLKKSEFKKEINALEREISNYRERKFGVNGELFKKQKELMKPIENKVFNVIKEIAKEKDLDFVFDRSGDIIFLYAKKKYDITNDVLDKLKKSVFK